MWNSSNFCSIDHTSGYGRRTRPLPPPQEVIDHDNAVKSILHARDFQTVEPTEPVEQVFLFLLFLLKIPV